MKRVGSASLWLILLASPVTWAEPYLAVRAGSQCAQCHVDPAGGGLRNPAGIIYGQTQLPAHQVRPADSIWTGEVGKMLQLGGDLRASADFTDTPDAESTSQFDLTELRLYAD